MSVFNFCVNIQYACWKQWTRDNNKVFEIFGEWIREMCDMCVGVCAACSQPHNGQMRRVWVCLCVVCVCVCVAYSVRAAPSQSVCLSVCLSANMRHGITYWATKVLHVRRTREHVLLSGTNCPALFDCTLPYHPSVFFIDCVMFVGILCRSSVSYSLSLIN